MTSAISSASSGLQAALSRAHTAGHNIANAATPEFQRQTAQAQERTSGAGVDTAIVRGGSPAGGLESDAVDLISSEYSFRANLRVLQTADRMLGSLLDEKA